MMGKFQAKIVNIAQQSSAKVLLGDVILKVNGVTVASDDGALLNGGTLDDVLTAIRQSPKRQILKFDVLREYSSGRRVSTMSALLVTRTAQDYANSNDEIHATKNDNGQGRGSSNAVAGLKITGLNDSDDETAE
jgi:hypothetical protein